MTKLRSFAPSFKINQELKDMEVRNLLRELARVWEIDIDEDYDMDWEV